MNDYYQMENDEMYVNAYDISVAPNDFNIMTINDLIENKVIAMPSFQRNYVWDRKRASKFIESLILGLPVPQVFLYQERRNRYSIIDGQQRLLTVYFFIKQKFPRIGKRKFLRKVFDDYGDIPNEILQDKDIFQDFKLQFPKFENGEKNLLEGKKYLTLTDAQRTAFKLMTMRCMTIRQNSPENNDSIYEIFSRLNTGGMNLSPQEIRGCLYRSDFYKMVYDLNSDPNWRALVGRKEEDDKFRDVEIIIRSFALLHSHKTYAGSMLRFINKFSKDAQDFSEEQIIRFKELFVRFLSVCRDIETNHFQTKSGSFNISLFDSVFVAVAEKLEALGVEDAKITQQSFDALKANKDFQYAITHSTSHADTVRKRLDLARQILYFSNSE